MVGFTGSVICCWDLHSVCCLGVSSCASSYLSLEHKSSSSGLDSAIGLSLLFGVLDTSSIFSFLISIDIPVDLVLMSMLSEFLFLLI